MPTLLIQDGFRFLFYANEETEPPHVHVIGRGGEAKVWLRPIEITNDYGLSPKDKKHILEIVQKNVKLFIDKYEVWHASSSKKTKH